MPVDLVSLGKQPCIDAVMKRRGTNVAGIGYLLQKVRHGLKWQVQQTSEHSARTVAETVVVGIEEELLVYWGHGGFLMKS